jgi:hypothetical protein
MRLDGDGMCHALLFIPLERKDKTVADKQNQLSGLAYTPATIVVHSFNGLNAKDCSNGPLGATAA